MFKIYIIIINILVLKIEIIGVMKIGKRVNGEI